MFSDSYSAITIVDIVDAIDCEGKGGGGGCHQRQHCCEH